MMTTSQYIILIFIFFFSTVICKIYKRKKYPEITFEMVSRNKDFFTRYLSRYYIKNMPFTIFCVVLYLLGKVSIILYLRITCLSLTNQKTILDLFPIDPEFMTTSFKSDVISVLFPVALKMILFIFSLILYNVLLDNLFFQEILKMHIFLYRKDFYCKMIQLFRKNSFEIIGKIALFFHNIANLRSECSEEDGHLDFIVYKEMYDNEVILQLSNLCVNLAKKLKVIHWVFILLQKFSLWLFMRIELEPIIPKISFLLYFCSMFYDIIHLKLYYSLYALCIIYIISLVRKVHSFARSKGGLTTDLKISRYFYNDYEQKNSLYREPWTTEEIKQTTALFEELIPQILDLKLTLGLFELDKQKKVIVWPKIFIFSMYFLCWSYILIISYYNYPIELPMFKIFIKNILMYLTIGEDLFIDNIYSVNENLVTIENMKLLILGIVKVIIKTKKQLILIIVLISIVIICSILMHKYYTYNEEQIFIKNCIEDCLKDVYGYMTHNINKNYYGCLKVYIGNEKHSMLSSYYEILINKENIENYLKSLNWQEIITMKKKNIAAIKEYVIEGYTEHMKKPEEIYTVNILINTNIKEIKTDLTNILKIRAANIINSDEFIAKFLNDIDWNLYLRTMEFKNKTYVKLVEIFDKKVQEKEHQQIQEA